MLVIICVFLLKSENGYMTFQSHGQDIVAYVIARTLQAFEHHPHVKFGESKSGILASKKEALPFKKSEDPTIERRHANPAIQLEQVAEETTDGPGSGDGGNSASKDSSGGGGRGATKYLSKPNSRPSCTPYAANEELSGVGLFSPAPTRPTTPTSHRESKNSNPTSTLGSSFLMTSATRLEE
ncbi:uncharacterized protein EI90DRAFT_3123824 [Cantharellus anzutake]|uniref:uncharacterized protein n=1 Tax=Cantharellus anzutake TaxID=1750568 RepID=UPI001908D35D|nr:uncharacterized protein EI90DRAFT_3123824 [Cantharellus anzutake]KAF8331085.1 hypothetical protein EI90DRAFT_3123824 [Cantharellus anzutake]